MSWICQSLLRNRISIKTKQDIDSDEFNDLLVIESKIKDLHRDGFLSDLDIYIIDLVADGRPIRELEATLGKSRVTVSRAFIQICERIGYFLGGYFTDEGFLDNMKHSYKLSEEDMDKLRLHIDGKFKHKLLRSIK
jgi:hypothetical protein